MKASYTYMIGFVQTWRNLKYGIERLENHIAVPDDAEIKLVVEGGKLNFIQVDWETELDPTEEV